MTTTLGLDLGPNSIGWALIDQANSRIIDLGVRIFPEGVDNFDSAKEKSRNEDRRVVRGMRRQVARRARRKRILKNALQTCGLLPKNLDDLTELQQANPYDLRRRAASERITLHELGRVLLHLNQRRGFLSNSKKDEQDDKESKGMLAEISELQKTLGDRTLGQYLAEQQDQFDHAARHEGDRIRGKHTRRSMLIEEFDRIWAEQAKHHPELTDALCHGRAGRQTRPVIPRQLTNAADWLEAYGLFGILFFQRTMYWPKSMIGLCELEPKQPRCPRADRLAQRFRLLQEVNNLRLIDDHDERPLDSDQRALLLDHLAQKKEMTFDQIRKALGFTESVRFNLEKGKRPKLWGMPVDHALANKNAFGSKWWKLPDEQRNAIVHDLINPEIHIDDLRQRAADHWELAPDQIDAVINAANAFPDSYLALSRVALEKLLPHMERGLLYMADDESNSAMHAAGYMRPDQLKRRIFDKLPDPARTHDSPIGDLPNPVVRRTLVELRKLVNAIIREYGKPDAIHVEMAREVKQGENKRREYNMRMRERETLRDEAAKKLRNLHVKVTRNGINAYLAWQEQNGECPYCGKTISVQQLVGGDIDIDHILPYSRCLDDSQMNKVACHRSCNAAKGNRTPYEWKATADSDAYDKICQRARKLPYPKYRRFLQKELELDKFIARQLVDTGYIARATAEYLKCLFPNEKRHEVLGLKGQHTATLRQQWGLNTVLSPDDPKMKNRDDHRHHAVDAAIIALTDRSRLAALSRGYAEVESINTDTGEVGHIHAYKGASLPAPWNTFRGDVEERINAVNVSHRVQRKARGALHEDTFYGKTEKPGEFVVRKPIESLSASEVLRIRDDVVKKVVLQRLGEFGVEPGRGKGSIPKEAWATPLHMPTRNGTPGPEIRKVRIVKADLTIQPIRANTPNKAYVKPGSLHHLCLFEWDEKGKTKRDVVFVSLLEATNRKKEHQPIINRVHPQKPDARFLFSLSRGELVLADWKGEQKLLTFKTAASTQGQIYFAEHTDARRTKDYKQFVANCNTLNARKVTVDPLGRIRWAND